MEISYLKVPGSLGNQGTGLLIQILNDETKNLLPSEEEIKKFNNIVKQRYSFMNKTSWKHGIEKYALKKLFSEPTPSASDMISEFFLTQ